MILPTSSSRMYRLIPPTIETTAMRNVTPIVTPSRVKKLFSFCTRIWASASLTASNRDIGGGARDAHLRHPVLRDEAFLPVVAGDPAVADDDDAPRMRRDVRLVRDHDDGLSLIGEGLEDLHDVRRGRRVEVAGRLVRKE